jgi:colicin import membrane protein
LGEASTGPTDKASAAKASAPSGTYLGRLRARVRPNITFPESQLQAVKGNPEAEVEVTCSATGEILSQKLIRSSGNPAWDAAVMNAIEKTGTLPRDENGNMPPKISFGFKPRD